MTSLHLLLVLVSCLRCSDSRTTDGKDQLKKNISCSTGVILFTDFRWPGNRKCPSRQRTLSAINRYCFKKTVCPLQAYTNRLPGYSSFRSCFAKGWTANADFMCFDIIKTGCRETVKAESKGQRKALGSTGYPQTVRNVTPCNVDMQLNQNDQVLLNVLDCSFINVTINTEPLCDSGTILPLRRSFNASFTLEYHFLVMDERKGGFLAAYQNIGSAPASKVRHNSTQVFENTSRQIEIGEVTPFKKNNTPAYRAVTTVITLSQKVPYLYERKYTLLIAVPTKVIIVGVLTMIIFLVRYKVQTCHSSGANDARGGNTVHASNLQVPFTNISTHQSLELHYADLVFSTDKQDGKNKPQANKSCKEYKTVYAMIDYNAKGTDAASV